MIDSVDDVEPVNFKSTDFSRRRTVICEAQSSRVFFPQLRMHVVFFLDLSITVLSSFVFVDHIFSHIALIFNFDLTGLLTFNKFENVSFVLRFILNKNSQNKYYVIIDTLNIIVSS